MNSFIHVRASEDKGFLQFSFDCIVFPGGKKYQVSVLTRGPQPHHFVMEERAGQWRIGEAPLVPGWIKRMEAELGELIRQQGLLSNNTDPGI